MDRSIQELRRSRVCSRWQQYTARSMDQLHQQLQCLATDHPHLTTLCQATPRLSRATSMVPHYLPAKAMDRYISRRLLPSRPVSCMHRQVGLIHHHQCQPSTRALRAIQPVQSTPSCTPAHSAHMSSSTPPPITRPRQHISLRSRCRPLTMPLASQHTILDIITASQSPTRPRSIHSPLAGLRVVDRAGNDCDCSWLWHCNLLNHWNRAAFDGKSWSSSFRTVVGGH